MGLAGDEKGGTSVSKSGFKAGRLRAFLVVGAGSLVALGCQTTPIDLSAGPAPLRTERPEEAPSYEDSLTGGEVFSMYCNQCHNARALAERPFSNYQNVAAHMRVRANLTGKEYEKLLAFLRKWADVPSPVPPTDKSPKRLMFSQPIAELRDQAGAAAAPAGGPVPGTPQLAEAPPARRAEAVPPVGIPAAQPQPSPAAIAQPQPAPPAAPAQP
jgi:hypothetical protein